MEPSKKQFYFLASGQVYFHPTGKPEETTYSFENAIIANSTGKISTMDLGRAQQALQIQLHNKIQGQELIVVNVVFSGISPLGEMTHEEFYNVPSVQ